MENAYRKITIIHNTKLSYQFALHSHDLSYVRNGLYYFAVIVYFIILEYMVLRPLVRTLAFHVIYLFWNVSCVISCILRRLVTQTITSTY